ncbi:MAG TPA: DUF2127 domain-containing protein [Candidatus Saccharimonadia bacterium]|nr:DUF2127 domain-containing protein [Candidatus Saccharimonadia bacterium]
MTLSIPQPLLDKWFKVAVILKGVDGYFEVLGGLLLLAIPLDRTQDALLGLAFYEVQPGQHAFIGNYLARVGQQLDPHWQLIAALYLLVQGSIKIVLVIALMQRKYFLYPWAIGFMVAFIFYLSYRIGYDRSILLAVLTLFDCVVAYLTYLEWNRHRENPSPA